MEIRLKALETMSAVLYFKTHTCGTARVINCKRILEAILRCSITRRKEVIFLWLSLIWSKRLEDLIKFIWDASSDKRDEKILCLVIFVREKRQLSRILEDCNFLNLSRCFAAPIFSTDFLTASTPCELWFQAELWAENWGLKLQKLAWYI